MILKNQYLIITKLKSFKLSPKIDFKIGIKKMINDDHIRLKKIKLPSIPSQKKLIKKFNFQK